MLPLTNINVLPIRERRLGAIDAYWGQAQPLIKSVAGKKAAQRIRTFSQTKQDEISYALQLLSQIKEVAIVVHGPKGCSSISHYLSAFQGNNTSLISTNLNEDDTIMGSSEKLADAIKKAYSFYKSKVIFAVATPTVAINNDDIDSVAAELTEELGIEIVPIYTDGFKSKIGANGHDIVFQALANHLIPESLQTEEQLVNVITGSQRDADAWFIYQSISALKLRPNVFPQLGHLKALQKSSKAFFSIGTHPQSHIFGEYLQNQRAIPFTYALPPIGLKATLKWIEFLGNLFDRQNLASRLIETQIEKFQSQVAEITASLEGLKIYISGDASLAVSLAGLAEEFGLQVVGLSLSDLDQSSVEFIGEQRLNELRHNLHIAEGQLFELVNILLKSEADIFLGDLGEVAAIAKLGIPAICHKCLPLYGPKAALSLAEKIKLAIDNKSLVKRLASAKPVYNGSWLQKNPGWYIKQEVR